MYVQHKRMPSHFLPENCTVLGNCGGPPYQETLDHDNNHPTPMQKKMNEPRNTTPRRHQNKQTKKKHVQNSTEQFYPRNPYRFFLVTPHVPSTVGPYLHIVVVVKEIDIPGPPSIVVDEIGITWGPFIPRVRSQHALDTHADALDGLNRRPPRGTQQIQADDAIAVDMGMDRNRTRGIRCSWHLDKLHFRRLYIWETWLAAARTLARIIIWPRGPLQVPQSHDQAMPQWAQRALHRVTADSPIGYFDENVNLSRYVSSL